MTRRQWEILFACTLLVVAVLFLLWLLRTPAPTTVPPQPTAPTNLAPSGNATLPPPVSTTPVAPLTPSQVGATNTARLFAERLGSYSTEANFANVDDVKAMASAAFQAELARIAENARREALTGVYYGVSTRVLGTTVKEQTDTQATIEVLTQREEVNGAATNDATVRNQTMTVQVVFEDGSWKVSGFTWGE